MIGTITHILAKAGYKAMNGTLADERRRLAGAVSPAAYVSYDPRLLAGAGWYGYRIALKGGDRQMVDRARYMLAERYTIRDSYEYYADGIYTFGVLLRQRVKLYGIGGGSSPVVIDPTWLYFTMPEGGTVTLTKNGSPPAVTLEYSLDNGSTWTKWTESGNVRTLTLNAGQTLHVRNTNENGKSFSTNFNEYYTFGFSDWCNAGGDVASLARKTPDSSVNYGDFVLCGVFRNALKLLTPPLITVEKNGIRMLERMFDGCENMLYAPALRLSVSLYGQYVFQNCKTITEGAIFKNFSDTIGNNGLYGCYYGCTSLKSVSFPFKTLGYQALSRALYNCSSLVEIKTSFTDISGSNCLANWVSGVAATGDFYCPASLTIPSGASGIPNGWTRHDI